MNLCKHCKIAMDDDWYKTTKGYCYTCGINGFHIIREIICRRIISFFQSLLNFSLREATE